MRAIVASVLPALALLGFTVLVFFDELVGGPMAYGRDTTAFYYPLSEWAAGELSGGRLPFWLPLIFGGYPLLADGEIGPLYPPNLLLLSTLPVPTAYVWLRAFHYGVATVGLFALARTLGIGRFGAWIGGLSFGFGSFMVGHLEHDNIVRSAAWLPWLLLAAERALRAGVRRRGRLLWTLVGGCVLALQCLGVHIQPVLLSAIALGAYLLAGPLGRRAALSADEGAPDSMSPLSPEPAARSKHRVNGKAGHVSTKASILALPRLLAPDAWLRIRLQIGIGMLALGGALAAAQLVPLYVLGRASLRPSLVTYDYATSYAVAPPQVLTLLFPYMFHFDAARAWSLWSPNESTLYVGVVPLVLAVLAAAFVRTRAALFFAAMALVSLVLCLGDYLPIKPYAVIWNLPGFAYLRAPARFSLLFGLALAGLAAIGADWIARRARARRGTASDGEGGPARALSFVGLVPFVLVALLFGLRWWLQHDPSTAVDVIRRTYLGTSRENWQLGPWHVYYGLLEFSRPDNARTAFGLLLLAVTPLLLRGWLRRPRLEPLWRPALAGLVLLDLWAFATGFHLRAWPEQLRPASSIVGWLADQPGPFRVFVEPSLNQTLGPNQLVSSGLATMNGYSSLESGDLREYWWSVVMQDNFLLDLFNVRYVLETRRALGNRMYQQTRFHPNDRLMSGQVANRSGSEAYRVAWTFADSLTVVGAVEGLQVADGTPVAELTLTGDRGERHTVPLLAGVDLGEYAADEPGYPTAEYVGPRVAWAGPSFTPDTSQAPVRLYGATRPVDPPFGVTGLEVRTLAATGRLHLHGLGVRSGDAVYSLRPSDNVKYHLLYDGWSTLLLENTAAWPRAFVVGGAVQAEPGVPLLDQMLERSWDPSRELLAENLRPADARWFSRPEPVGHVGILDYDAGRVSLRADLDDAGFLVLADRVGDGWRAWSNGGELQILRANMIQGAVALPAGSHVVTFVYDPWWVRLGFAVSTLALLGVLATLVALAVPAGRVGGRVGSRQ